MEVAENDFAVIAPGQVCKENIIATIVIAADAEDEATSNELIQMSLLLETNPDLDSSLSAQSQSKRGFCFQISL